MDVIKFYLRILYIVSVLYDIFYSILVIEDHLGLYLRFTFRTAVVFDQYLRIKIIIGVSFEFRRSIREIDQKILNSSDILLIIVGGKDFFSCGIGCFNLIVSLSEKTCYIRHIGTKKIKIIVFFRSLEEILFQIF